MGNQASASKKLKKQELNKLIKETHCALLPDM